MPFWLWGAAGGWARALTIQRRFTMSGPNRSPVAFSPALFLPRQRRKRGRNGKEREGKPPPRPPWAPWQVPGRFLAIRPKGNRPGAWLGGRAGAAAGCSALIIYPKKAGGANSGGQGPPPSKRPPGRKLGNAKKPGGGVCVFPSLMAQKRGGGANGGGDAPPPPGGPPGRKRGPAKKAGGGGQGGGGGPWALFAGGSPPAAVPEAETFPVPAGRGGAVQNVRRLYFGAAGRLARMAGRGGGKFFAVLIL